MKNFVTVFGSSLPKPGTFEYETAYNLGKYLGANKLNVCTGGFQGIMDAVSKGAAEEGAKAVGITAGIFSTEPSSYLTREIKCATLFERLQKLVEYGDAFIVLPGSTGTLLELSLVWEYFNKGLKEIRPCACYGEMWSSFVALIEKRVKIENRRTGLIKCFDDIDKCADFIISSLV